MILFFSLSKTIRRQRTYLNILRFLSLMQCYSKNDCLKKKVLYLFYVIYLAHAQIPHAIFPILPLQYTLAKYRWLFASVSTQPLTRYIALQNLYQNKRESFYWSIKLVNHIEREKEKKNNISFFLSRF